MDISHGVYTERLRYGTIETYYRRKKMLTKENFDDVKWDLMNYSTKSMHRYIKESTIEKVWALLDKEIDFEEIADYTYDNYGE
jgi:Na+/phosphate symporter